MLPPIGRMMAWATPALFHVEQEREFSFSFYGYNRPPKQRKGSLGGGTLRMVAWAPPNLVITGSSSARRKQRRFIAPFPFDAPTYFFLLGSSPGFMYTNCTGDIPWIWTTVSPLAIA